MSSVKSNPHHIRILSALVQSSGFNNPPSADLQATICDIHDPTRMTVFAILGCHGAVTKLSMSAPVSAVCHSAGELHAAKMCQWVNTHITYNRRCATSNSNIWSNQLAYLSILFTMCSSKPGTTDVSRRPAVAAMLLPCHCQSLAHAAVPMVRGSPTAQLSAAVQSGGCSP